MMVTGTPAKGLRQKWSIALKVIPLLMLVALLKFLAHRFGLEVMELNALFTSLVAGTIFLIGFLVAGVLSDYKESEKIPSELVASMKTLLDDTYTIHRTKDTDTARQFIEYQQSFAAAVLDWFHRKERTQAMLQKISSMNNYLVEFDKEGVQANYIIKLKNEQGSLRRMLLRIDTIRDTDFVGSAYAIVEAMGFVIVGGLITIAIEPFYMSLFFTLLITFLVSYMVLLIKCLDDPFDYSGNGTGGIEISLKPIYDHVAAFDGFMSSEARG